MPYYAVKAGRKPGIYLTMLEATLQINGYPNASHAKFDNRIEAYNWLNSTGEPSVGRESVLPVPGAAVTRSAQVRAGAGAGADKIVSKRAVTAGLLLYVNGTCQKISKGLNGTGWGVCVVDACDGSIIRKLFGAVVTNVDSHFFLGANYGSRHTAELTAIGEALLYVRDFCSSQKAYPGPVVLKHVGGYGAKSVLSSYNGSKNFALIQTLRDALETVQTQRGGRKVDWECITSDSNDTGLLCAYDLTGKCIMLRHLCGCMQQLILQGMLQT